MTVQLAGGERRTLLDFDRPGERLRALSATRGPGQSMSRAAASRPSMRAL